MGKALHITKTARGTKFIDSKVDGDVLIEGRDSSFIRTSIKNFQTQPAWKKLLEVILAIITITGVVFTILQYYKQS